jgi:CheY-like chemotaxis protein
MRTIVVIDDEPELLGLLQDVLEGEGYHVVTVDHPGMIAGAIAGWDPSLFLIDIMLPDVNGIAVAEQLNTGAYCAIPKIAMSASDEMIQRATRSGWFTGALEKPFDLESLLGCVARHVATWSSRGRDGRGAYAAPAQS